MAEDQNLKDDKQKDNENDPYNFFKFAGPKEPEKDLTPRTADCPDMFG